MRGSVYLLVRAARGGGRLARFIEGTVNQVFEFKARRTRMNQVCFTFIGRGGLWGLVLGCFWCWFWCWFWCLV